ncbi:MAG TPA: GAF domain-containing protein, partial [Gemmatimonadales bacterium]|nr:GAF domain-containing protein [Gemmatimonadales bacterium]
MHYVASYAEGGTDKEREGTPGYAEQLAATYRAFPMRPGPGGAAARAILNRAVVNIPDVLTDVQYQLAGLASAANYRSIAAIPILRDGEPVGVLAVHRAEPVPASDAEIAVLRTFADQAVIAIENVRLFTELEARNRELTESLEQQTATSEILGVISRSPTDVQPVLDAVAESAARLCGAVDALLLRVDGDVIRRVAHFGAITAVSDMRPVTR